MDILTTPEAMREWSRRRKAAAGGLGFVPTMGALHEGHLSLVRVARLENAAVVASVFVNPRQFAPGEDYARYPRTWDADRALLAAQGVEAVYLPSAETMYPEGHASYVDQAGPAGVLEGRLRPGHFRGVLTVVLKLFAAVEPDRAYFGAKDYQQTVVVRRMVRDLDLPVEVRVLPTARESDGLAMSSRNRYLSDRDRPRAACLYQALVRARERAAAGGADPRGLEVAMQERIAEVAPDAAVEYVLVADPETLEPAADLARGAVALIALRLGGVRLIDNLLLPPCESSAPRS